MIRDFLHGAGLPFRALQLIAKTPRLLGLSFLCAALASLALVAATWLAWRGGGALADALISGDSGWAHAASLGVHVLLSVALFAVGALTLPNLILAPVQDPLSEATERALGDPATAPSGFIRGTLISLRHTLVRLALMLLGLAVLFPLNFVPVAGSALWFVLSTLWSAFWLSAEYLSGPMARHHRRFREVLGALKKRPGATFGFGLALWVLLWLPVVNCFLMPLAVVAGTLLYREAA